MTQQPREPLQPDEARIARIYRALPDSEPSPAIDARVMAAARQSVYAGPRLRHGWPWGLGAAAAAVLAVGMFWRLQLPPDETSVYGEMPAAPASTRDARDAEEAIPQLREEAAPAETRQRALRDSAIDEAPRGAAPPAVDRPAARPEPAPARERVAQPPPPPAPAAPPPHPVAAPQAGRDAAPPPRPFAVPQAERDRAAAQPPAAKALQSEGAASEQRTQPAERAPLGVAAGARRAEETTEQARRQEGRALAEPELADFDLPPPEADEQLPPAQWLVRIRARLRSGDEQGAAASLRRFRAMHPEYEVPADLRDLDE